MRLSLVTETYPPEINGVAMTLSRLVGQLSDRRIEVQIVRPRQGPEDRATSAILIPGMPIPGYQGLRMGLPCSGRLRKLWTQERPDLVHVATEGPLGWSALRAAKALSLPVTSSFHTNFHAYGQHYGVGLFRQAGLAWLRGFHNATLATFAPTPEICESLTSEGFERLRILGRGVDTRLFTPAKRSSQLRRQWLGPQESGFVLLYVGRLAAEKNLNLAIDSYRGLKQSQPDCRMVLVGDGPLRAKLEKNHPDLIFCGMQQGEALATHYASGDIFLFPSLTETFGNVITEAMASGLLVLAYNYAAARLHIRHGVNGLVVDGESPEAFRQAALSLPEMREAWDAMRNEARQTILPLSWDKVVDDFEKALREYANISPPALAQP